ncbi:MAG TPA: HEPN domain-containing protein [Methylobacter sp.]
MSVVQSHRAKTKQLAELCKVCADNDDTRIQGYLAKYLVIMASAYIEISVKEELSIFCDTRSHPSIREFVKTTVSWENSLGCSKIESILNKFDRRLWAVLKDALSEEEMLSIDSLKALRDQIAHGKDNNTGYLVVSRYFDAIVDFPEKLAAALNTI